jgi:DNA mismatch repair protein MutS2
MKVHKDVWRLLEMDKVLSIFASNVRSNLGLQTLAHLAPSENLENLYQRQELLRAYRDYVDRSGDFPWTQNVDSVEDLLLSARKTGLLLGRELLSVRTLLLLAEKIKAALSSIKEEVPPFGVLLRKIRDFSQEMKALSVLDEDGNLFDSASPDLSRIRKSEDSVRQTIRARAQSIFSNPRFNSMLQEKILSYRQNRFTVLVRQEFASRFPGTIVDRSGSGNSVYMEPRSMADLNSRLVLLLRDEEEEKRRILSEITAQVLSRERAILDAEKVLGQIDLLYAVTTVMDKKKWKLPLLAEKPLFAFHSLLHPLLGEHGVPLSIECGRDFRILVVTGPNTGGKTVTLKAVGVGTILAWCGLPIPAYMLILAMNRVLNKTYRPLVPI